MKSIKEILASTVLPPADALLVFPVSAREEIEILVDFYNTVKGKTIYIDGYCFLPFIGESSCVRLHAGKAFDNGFFDHIAEPGQN